MTYLKLHNLVKRLGYSKGSYRMWEVREGVIGLTCRNLPHLNDALKEAGLESEICNDPGYFPIIKPLTYIQVKLK